MAVYPLHRELQKHSLNMQEGNFALWYNKFIPLDSFEKCNACGNDNRKETAVEMYASQYKGIKRSPNLKNHLVQKHDAQKEFCESFSLRYEKLEFTAKLTSPLITGIGESHPHEISMVFDHNLGIPYIPSSGVKGIVRFAHTLGLLGNIPENELEDKDYFDDEKYWTNIPQLFGTQGARGSVIFLDAYPETVPDLHIDIMNPHYGDYYGDDTKPPADYLNPVPIKFLTVAKGTIFVFRALIAKEHKDLLDKVKNAFRKALTEEGVGAKTAVGYGTFELVKDGNRFSANEESGPLLQKNRKVAEAAATPGKEKSSEEQLRSSTVRKEDAGAQEVWEKATLSWYPGNNELKASVPGKKPASVKGKDVAEALVPESLHKRLFDKRKSVSACVEVRIEGNLIQVLKIEEAG